MMEYEGPVYIRLSRQEVSRIYPEDLRIEIGKAQRVREGKDVTIAVTGAPLAAVLNAADI